MRSKHEEVATLLRKAHGDLLAARTLTSAGLPDIVCFHAQQAAEKAIKALMAARGIRYPLVHNLQVLLGLLQDIPTPIAERQDDVEQLTEYATAERYEDIVRPPLAAVQLAIEAAQLVYDTVIPEVQALGFDTLPKGTDDA